MNRFLTGAYTSLAHAYLSSVVVQQVETRSDEAKREGGARAIPVGGVVPLLLNTSREVLFRAFEQMSFSGRLCFCFVLFRIIFTSFFPSPPLSPPLSVDWKTLRDEDAERVGFTDRRFRFWCSPAPPSAARERTESAEIFFGENRCPW